MLISAILASLAISQVLPLKVQQDGTTIGYAKGVNCTGSLTCTVLGPTVTMEASGTGGTGGTPSGAVGALQTKASSSTFGAYAGAACTTGQFATAVSAAGALTCEAGGVGATGPAGAAATITVGTTTTGTAAVTNSGTTSAAVLNFVVPQGPTGATGATGPAGPIVAATATVLGGVKGTGTALVCSGTQKATGFDVAGALQCGADQDTVYTLPNASTTLGGVKMAGACSAGNHVASIVAGELTCTADAGGGGGAPTTSTYILKTADAALTNAQVMGVLGTGLVKNTTATGVQSIAVEADLPFSGKTQYGVTYWATATSLGTTTAGTGGQVLLSAGGAGAPTWGGISLTATGVAANQGTIWQSLHGNAAGQPTWAASSAYTITTATWASAATAGTLGIVGTGATPLTSPVYAAAAPFSFHCVVPLARPSAVNQPRYGIQSSGTVTTINTQVRIGLAGTAPALTEALQSTTALATAACAAGCTASVVTGGAIRTFIDTIEGSGVMNASGTLSLVMAPSAAAAHTAQIGARCEWY